MIQFAYEMTQLIMILKIEKDIKYIEIIIIDGI
jgi:hypothetical protein